MNDQRMLSTLFVEELRKRGALEDVICEYGIESLRECSHCHRLKNQGWIYHGFETYCSDNCLMEAHPEEDLEEMRREASSNRSDTYWTAWED